MGLAASVGLALDEAQRLILEGALAERHDGSWSASQVAVIQPRQNGKTALLAAVALGALFLFREPLTIWTAHRFSTALESWRMMRDLVTGSDHLRRRVKGVRRTTFGGGEVELTDGSRVIFLSRSAGASGRGFSGDRLFLDEAFDLTDDDLAALLPALSARPNHQVWFASSAPKAHSEVLRRLCMSGRKGDPGLAYFEWCAADEAASDDRSAWAQANPAFGPRITQDTILGELRSMSEEDFRRERLGIWREDLAGAWQVIPEAAWAAAQVGRFRLADPVALAADVTPDRTWSAIAVAGRLEHGGRGVELIDHRPGVGWVIERLAELDRKHQPCVTVTSDRALADAAEQAGLKVYRAGAGDMASAANMLHDGIAGSAPDVRHLPDEDLTAAVAGATKRQLGDGWAWDRRSMSINICPLVASSLALWGLGTPRVQTQTMAPFALMGD